jgi:hypothetical protein
MQILKHGLDEFWSAPLRIEILVSQNEGSRVLPSALRGNPKCSGVSDV